MTQDEDRVLIDIFHSSEYDSLTSKELDAIAKPYVEPSPVSTPVYAEELVARICHEMNRKFCELNAQFIHPTWDELDYTHQQQLCAAVHNARFSNFSFSENHENWCQCKIKDGWVLGKEVSVDKKTHNCLKPYEALPVEQKMKDQIFLTIVRGYYAAVPTGVGMSFTNSPVNSNELLAEASEIEESEEQL